MTSWTNEFHCEIMVVHNIRTRTSFCFSSCYWESQDNTCNILKSKLVIFPTSSCLMQKCTEQGERYQTVRGVSCIFDWSNCSLQKNLEYFSSLVLLLFVWVKICQHYFTFIDDIFLHPTILNSYFFVLVQMGIVMSI